MSEDKHTRAPEARELAEQLRGLRNRFEEFRGRL
jgi:hypothetical protein